MGQLQYRKLDLQNFVNLFENISDNIEFINQITKIFETIPNQVPG